jgi:hypothetical protein
MFRELIREAVSDPNNFNQDGKIAALENEFGHDPVALAVSYSIATSHEYSTPNVAAAIAFVKDYDWEQSSWRVDGLQGINKPINEAKVKEIANTIREKGNDFPLVTVDKFHGITPQTPGKLLLMDGHHRQHGLEEVGHETTPIYKGTYKGHDRLNESSDIVLEAFFGKGEVATKLRYLNEAAKRKKTIEKLPLSEEEQAAVTAKYGQPECSFHKNAATGKYFCMTHRYKSDEFDSPTDIPVSDVQFVSSTS